MTIRLMLACALLVASCGSTPPPVSADGDGSAADRSPGLDGSSKADRGAGLETSGSCSVDAVCRPYGIWRLGLPAGSERVEIRPGDLLPVVTFLDRKAPQDSCSPPSQPPASALTSVNLSANGCTVTLQRKESYCWSGETQCSELEVTLELCGDENRARGRGTTCRCWDPGPSCMPTGVTVTATREGF
jgi:hypothetical protein